MNRPLPRGLYAICDDQVRPELSLEAKLRALLDGGAKVIQLRLKRTTLRQASAISTSLVGLCRHAGAGLIVNDRVDLSLACGADGAHVGDEDLPPALARKLLPAGAWLGVTVRDVQGARRAHAEGATYVGAGPVFATGTKRVAHAELGLDGLRAIVSASPLPVVAIAGITLENIASVAATGVHGAAVVSDLLCAGDIAERARRLADAFARGSDGVASTKA